jgi:hypothetical protein
MIVSHGRKTHARVMCACAARQTCVSSSEEDVAAPRLSRLGAPASARLRACARNHTVKSRTFFARSHLQVRDITATESRDVWSPWQGSCARRPRTTDPYFLFAIHFCGFASLRIRIRAS